MIRKSRQLPVKPFLKPHSVTTSSIVMFDFLKFYQKFDIRFSYHKRHEDNEGNQNLSASTLIYASPRKNRTGRKFIPFQSRLIISLSCRKVFEDCKPRD